MSKLLVVCCTVLACVCVKYAAPLYEKQQDIRIMLLMLKLKEAMPTQTRNWLHTNHNI